MVEHEEEIGVDLIFHYFSMTLPIESAEKIVRPYYLGNVSEALRDPIKNQLGKKTLFSVA